MSELEKRSGKQTDLALSAEAMERLEADLSLSEATIAELQGKLNEERQEREKLLNDFKKAGEQIAKLEAQKSKPIANETSDGSDLEAYKLLEEQLVTSQMEVEGGTPNLQNELEEQGRVALEQRLEKAISLISKSNLNSPVNSDADPESITKLKEEIANKDKNIGNLKDQLSGAIEELALRESELEILQAVDSKRRN